MLDRMLLSAPSDEKLFVEDVFSSYLYTGNGSTQTITNGINLSGQGGLVWTKSRSGAFDHILADTVRGGNNVLYSDSNVGNQAYSSTIYNNFGSTGYTLGTATEVNNSSYTYASWTFRKAPKFFDVVTWTGNGTFKRVLNHSLGVAPGFIVVKRTDTTSNWWTYHRGVAGSINGYLNLTNAFTNTGYVEPGSVLFGENPAAVFDVFNAGSSDDLNVSGATYVAYLFAHDPTADGIIQCGSFSGNASYVADVNLGWEPQWVLVKNINAADDWRVFDNMRGMPVGTADARLVPNTSAAENSSFQYIDPTATGFTFSAGPSVTAIYIAIRRGPMKTPTSGTSVFMPSTESGNITTNFPVDAYITQSRAAGDTLNPAWTPRLVSTGALFSSSTSAEFANFWPISAWQSNTQFLGGISANYVSWAFRRAPGFFDVVAYTGTGVTRTVNHNLGVAPKLWIVKRRDSAAAWPAGTSVTGTATSNHLILNSSNAMGSNANEWIAPTATTFGIGTAFPNDNIFNASGGQYIAYLFASCPGVSKVFSFTGNGSSQTINCGFSGGARFVMIKRTDSAGDWYVWDTARGLVTSNDPHLSLNTTAAEVTTDDTIDPDSTGFIVNQVSATNVNVSGASYIGLAVA